MASQQAHYNPQSNTVNFIAASVWYLSVCPHSAKKWLLTGLVARCNRNEESQVLEVPGFR